MKDNIITTKNVRKNNIVNSVLLKSIDDDNSVVFHSYRFYGLHFNTMPV